MNKSESVNELAAALAGFQAKMPMVPKLHTGKIEGIARGSGKAYSYEYMYADMGDAVEASRPHLAEWGLAVVQSVEHDEDGHLLTTLVMHKSGQWIEGSMRLMIPEGATPQAQGSAITYARRYSYCASLGIVADTDDDGSLAQMAYGEGSGRRRTPPKRTGSRPITATDPRTDGKTEASPEDKNTILDLCRKLDPPITSMGAVALYLSDLIGEQIVSPAKLSDDQAKAALAKMKGDQ